MVSARWKSRVLRRKFLREIGSIVLGVLIALALGAVAGEIGWKMEVGDAKAAIANELGEIVGQGRERIAADACIEKRLDGIGALIDAAPVDGRLPPTGRLGDPIFRTWSTGVWDSTRSAQIASHMGRDLQDDLSGVYRFVDIINEATDHEVEAWTRLYAIVGPGRTISSEEIVALRNALTDARLAHRQILVASRNVDRFSQELHLPVDQRTARKYETTKDLGECRTIAPYAGEHYGEAPFLRLAAAPI